MLWKCLDPASRHWAAHLSCDVRVMTLHKAPPFRADANVSLSRRQTEDVPKGNSCRFSPLKFSVVPPGGSWWKHLVPHRRRVTQQSSQLDLDLLQYTHSSLASVGKRQNDSTVSCEELKVQQESLWSADTAATAVSLCYHSPWSTSEISKWVFHWPTVPATLKSFQISNAVGKEEDLSFQVSKSIRCFNKGSEGLMF